MVCKKAPGKIARHQVLNDIIWRAFNAAGIPANKEPSGLNRQDGRQPDGLTLPNPMARWEASRLGCHCCQHAGPVVRRHCRHRSGTGG